MARPAGRRWIRTLIVLALAPVALWLMLRWFEERQVYFPHREFDASGGDLGRKFEDVQFAAADGVRLNGWFYPADAASPRAGMSILICHGNAGNISHRLALCDRLLELGTAVFAIDYRGYGRSEGKPSEAGTYLDAQAAHRWLRDQGFAATNIVAFGESLGGGVVSELALREELAGIVLQSSFTSIPDIGAELFPFLPVRLIARIRYDTRAKLPRIRIPVAILHGRGDTLIRFHHAERNFAAANEPKLLWELAGDHNDQPEANPAKFLEGLRRFLDLIDRTRAAKPPPTADTPDRSGPGKQ